MNKLYIIGNGFDLKHGLPSRYSDFAEFCKKINWELYEQLTLLFPKISGESLWSNFEKGLGEVDESILRKKFYEPYKKNCSNDKFLCLHENLKLAFKDWVLNLRGLTNNLHKHYFFDANSYFISFNYTDTLETVYGIEGSKIKHIHGFAHRGEEEFKTDYIFGHNKEKEKTSMPIDSYEYLSADLINGLAKEYKTEDLRNKLKEWRIDFKDIFTLGHSLDFVDAKYFELLHNIFPDARWHIEYFDYDDYCRKMRYALSYDLSKNGGVEFIKS